MLSKLTFMGDVLLLGVTGPCFQMIIYFNIDNDISFDKLVSIARTSKIVTSN